jgi:pectate lyase
MKSGSTCVPTGGDSGAACPPPYVFCDDFEDGNAAGWTMTGGAWSVVDDGTKVYQGSGSGESSADYNRGDVNVEARVKVVTFGGTSDSYRAGIIARQGGSGLYSFNVSALGNLTIRQTAVGPPCGAPVPSGVDPLQWVVLRLEVRGFSPTHNLKGYVNGVLMIECNSPPGPLNGQSGVLTYGSGTVARFDDIRVSVP